MQNAIKWWPSQGHCNGEGVLLTDPRKTDCPPGDWNVMPGMPVRKIHGPSLTERKEA